jgi:hypothetical protein
MAVYVSEPDRTTRCLTCAQQTSENDAALTSQEKYKVARLSRSCYVFAKIDRVIGNFGFIARATRRPNKVPIGGGLDVAKVLRS